jgi:hypothetical protein
MFPSLKSSDVLVNSFFLKGICMLLSDQTLAAIFSIPAPNLTDLQNSTRFSRQFPPELFTNQEIIVLCVVKLNKKTSQCGRFRNWLRARKFATNPTARFTASTEIL